MWQYNNGKLWLPSGNQSWLAGKSLFLDDFRGEKYLYIYIDDFTQFSCDFPVFFPLKPPFTSHVPASHMGLSENRVPLNPFTTIFPIKQLFLMGIPTFRQTMVDIGGLPPWTAAATTSEPAAWVSKTWKLSRKPAWYRPSVPKCCFFLWQKLQNMECYWNMNGKIIDY